MKMRAVLLFVSLVLPACVATTEQTAILPFGEAQKALGKAFEYIDAGKIRFKNAVVKHDDVEPVSVSYGFDRPEKLITVDFRVKSTVRSNYFEYVYGIVSIFLDQRGELRGQTGGEHQGGPPSKEGKIIP